MKHGKLPKKIFVLHKCDNPLCVRDFHLFKGTQADNLKDMDAKGRRVCGGAVLSSVQVAEIREIYPRGEITQRDLAKQYGVTQSNISYIVRRFSWC